MEEERNPKCAEQVALELTKMIYMDESKKGVALKPDPRTYFLTLYGQCLKIVRGESIDDISDKTGIVGR